MIERPIENLQGSVILKPVEAQLERNLHAFVKMDPYCVAMIGSTQIKGQVCKSGGLNPLWTDAMVLQLRNDEPLFLEVKDRQILSGDSTIGVCEIDLKSLFEEKAATKWYELYFKKKLAGKILIDATYTEENYGSRHVIYTNLKPVRKVEQPPPVAAKVVQKHMPGAQDTLVLPQDSMRGSAGMRFGSSPGSGKKENPVAHPESPTKAGLANSEALPITQPIVSQEPQNDLAKPAKTRKKSTGAKFLKSIKNMFDIKSTKKSQPQQPLSANPANNDDIVPLTRTRPATQGYASTGGVPVINPNDGILERKLPAEPPKPSLKDYLSNENRNQMMLNRPVEPISQGNGFVRTLNPVTAEYTNDKLIDQYRSVGYRDQGEFRKVPDLRLSDRNLAVQDPGSGQKMTPDWKSNDVYGNGSIGQSQEVKPKRISDLLQNREVFNYR